MTMRNMTLGLGLACVLLSGSKTADAQIEDIEDVCDAEIAACSADQTCIPCLLQLASVDISELEDEFPEGADCNTQAGVLCDIAETDFDCDVTNENVLNLAGCIMLNSFNCPDFSTCDIPDATPSPTTATATTPGPTASIATPTTSPELATPAPTTGSRVITITESPTSAPTSAPSSTDTLPTGESTPAPADGPGASDEDSGSAALGVSCSSGLLAVAGVVFAAAAFGE